MGLLLINVNSCIFTKILFKLELHLKFASTLITVVITSFYSKICIGGAFIWIYEFHNNLNALYCDMNDIYYNFIALAF